MAQPEAGGAPVYSQSADSEPSAIERPKWRKIQGVEIAKPRRTKL